MTQQWYWCLDHDQAEPAGVEGAAQGPVCAAARRMGPYPSREEAANWREAVKTRNEAWDEEDEAWEGR